MTKLTDLKDFECFKTKDSKGLDFFFAKDTFVDKKGNLFQNCNCGKCSACFRTANNLKNKIGHLDNIEEVKF